MSSTDDAAEETYTCCANCGIAGVDDITLQGCTDCDLVKYCGDKCQENHREQHEEECKKRQALLHDRKLFTQPDEAHHGECPLCFLPLPLEGSKSGFYSCCSQYICMGCAHANYMSNKHDIVKARSCPFCREPVSRGNKKDRKRLMKRVKANDPVAMKEMGVDHYEDGNYDGALEYWTKAAELGDIEARITIYQLCMGRGRVLRRMRKRECIIGRRQPLVDIPELDTDLHVLRGEMEISKDL